jgi:hypothetical protein
MAKPPVPLEGGRGGVQRAVIRLYESVGCYVARTSPGRKGGTFQTPGIPDLYVFPPLQFVRFDGAGAPFWHETKRPGGKQRPGQVQFQGRCADRGVRYVLGGLEEARRALIEIGLLVKFGGKP